jgi:photosystem II stability/assembly factor-like uncharacterized protein
LIGRLGAVLLAVAAAGAAAAAGGWQTQYLYDEDRSSLVIVDLQMASAKRGVAVGYVQRDEHQDPVSLVTSDGGQHWRRTPLKKMPVSLFFLNEGLGWMVTDKGHLWKTTEAGESWTELPKPPGEILRVHFTSETDGWAAGAKKSILETHDGGRHWSAVQAAAEPPGKAELSAYNVIAFANQQYGFIGGLNLPPQAAGPDLPAWMDPQSDMSQHRLPHLIYAVATLDGGKTWKASSVSVFGETSRLRLLPNGQGLGLLVYAQDFYYPSEVYKIDLRTGRSTTIYKDQKFAVSDVWLDADGTVYLAGTVSQAKLRDVVPGKVQVLTSKDDLSWTEMPVDYRASALRVILASAEGEMWMATDSGMILKLAR